MGYSHRAMPDDEKMVEVLPMEGYVEVRFFGPFSVLRFNRQVDLAVAACLERDCKVLLIDETPLRGKPTTLEYYQIGVHGAQAGRDLHRVAVIANEEQLDPERLGRKVASNRGLTILTTTDRQKAVGWLLDPASSK